jgi:hypothetical protein
MTAEALARLSDRMEIRDLLTRYCRGVDRLDAVDLAAVFHQDAVVEKASGVLRQPAYVEHVIERQSQIRTSAHQITGVLVDFLGADRAFVQSWGMAVERHDELGVPNAVDLLYRVRYGDTMERRDGVWRIAHRVLVADHVMKVPVSIGVAELTAAEFESLRSLDDPIEKLRAASLAR